MIEEYGRNINGIDYFVGDIHGCYELLLETLENIDFDFHNDRLFATGDIIDRGHGSIDMLELLNEEWFFTVIGNHESDIQEFILEDFGTATVDDTNHSRLYWEYEDGEWYGDLNTPTRVYVDSLIGGLSNLPYIIRVGDIVVLHGEYYGDFNNILDSEINTILRDRTRIQNNDTSIVDNIGAIVVGHSIVPTPIVLGNTVYIDTGAFSRNMMTILSYDEITELVS